MRIKDNTAEYVIYCLFCILTLGTLFLLRVLITQGVKQSFDNSQSS